MFIYIKISKDLLAKKKKKKKASELYQHLSREEKERKHNMFVNIIKISPKMKNKSLSSIEQNNREWEKTLNYNCKKLLSQKMMT